MFEDKKKCLNTRQMYASKFYGMPNEQATALAVF